MRPRSVGDLCGFSYSVLYFFMQSLLNLVAAGKTVGKPSAFSRRKIARRSGAGIITTRCVTNPRKFSIQEGVQSGDETALTAPTVPWICGEDHECCPEHTRIQFPCSRDSRQSSPGRLPPCDRFRCLTCRLLFAALLISPLSGCNTRVVLAITRAVGKIFKATNQAEGDPQQTGASPSANGVAGGEGGKGTVERVHPQSDGPVRILPADTKGAPLRPREGAPTITLKNVRTAAAPWETGHPVGVGREFLLISCAHWRSPEKRYVPDRLPLDRGSTYDRHPAGKPVRQQNRRNHRSRIRRLAPAFWFRWQNPFGRGTAPLVPCRDGRSCAAFWCLSRSRTRSSSMGAPRIEPREWTETEKKFYKLFLDWQAPLVLLRPVIS